MEEENKSVDISLDITNEEILNSMDELKKAPGKANFLALMEKLDHARVLVPLALDIIEGKKIVAPMPLMTGDGRIFQPVYTDKDSLAKGFTGSGVANIDFNEILDLVVKQSASSAQEGSKKEKMIGIVINPKKDNVLLPMDELCEIAFKK